MSTNFAKIVTYEGVYFDEEDNYSFTMINDDWISWTDVCPDNVEEVENQIVKDFKEWLISEQNLERDE